MATALPQSNADATSARPMPPRASMLAAVGLAALALAPLLASHFHQLWARPHYQFFPIVFLGAATLAYMRFPGLASLRPGGLVAGWSLFGFSWLLLAAAELLNSSYLAAVATLVLLLAAIWAAGGAALTRSLLPAWLFLGLIIPPPFGLDNTLVLLLQRLTTHWSSSLLDQFGVFHLIAGNVFEVGERRLFVAEACTGINSLFSILACAIFYVLFTRTGPIRSVLLVLAALCWVLLANVLRIFLVAYLAKRTGADLAEGWRHDALGFVLFGIALGLIWSTDRLLLFLTPARWRQRPAPADPTPPAGPTESPPVLDGLRRGWLDSYVAGFLFALLVVGHFTLYALPSDAPPVQASAIAHLDRIDKAALPEKLDGWRCESYSEETRNPGSAFGEFSRLWVFRGEAQAGTFSFDFPFPAWHELRECYRNQGWEVEDKADHAEKERGGPSHYFERTLKKAGMRHGHLFFCEFDRTGLVLDAERGGLEGTMRRIGHKSPLSSWLDPGPTNAEASQTPAAPIYQFQLFIESDAPLSPAASDAAKARFVKAYQALRDKLWD